MEKRCEISERTVIAEIRRTLKLEPRRPFDYFYFDVAENAVELGVKLTYSREHRVQLYISLHGPDGFRGNRMNLSGYGELESDLWIGINNAGPGGIAGPIPAGRWFAQLDIDYLDKDVPISIDIYAVYKDNLEDYKPLPVLEDRVVKAERGWYKGELHCHSIESDGHAEVSHVVDLAAKEKLDYLAISDHFTTSQWNKLAEISDKYPMALLHSCEITSHMGHANMHGLKRWVNVYVNRPGCGGMNEAADDVHSQGGLFCVNHAYSGGCSWKDFDFDFAKADLIEIYHDMEGPNVQQQIDLWDSLLNRGYRITGVSGMDTHWYPPDVQPQRPHALTWVLADELSEKGILDGLRAGHAYVSRGTELRFNAVNAAGSVAEMGDTLPMNGNPVTFEMKYLSEKKLRCFIYRDGMLWDSFPLEDSAGQWRTYSFTVPANRAGIFRVELHELYVDPEYKGVEWHDFRTAQAMSNPIFLES